MNKTIMKGLFLFLVLLALAVAPLHAQQWCPPGATWHFGFNYAGSNGYHKYTHEGDTIIGGITEQIIGNEGHYYMQNPPGYHVIEEADIRTRMADGVLYAFHNPPGGQSGAGWDTLIWYSAVPGDHWQVLQPDDFQCDIRFLVTDTGHTELGGMNLRYVQTTVMEGTSELGTRRFLERIGSLHGTFRGECIDINTDTTLRCYQDMEMNYSPPNAPACDFISAIGEGGTPSIAVAAFPNPGTGVLHLETSGDMLQKVLLRDALGRVCLRAHPNAYRTELDVCWLSPGLYTVQIYTPKGIRTLHWVKQ